MNTLLRSLPLGAALAVLAAPPAAAQSAASGRTLFSISYQGPTIGGPDCATGVALTEGDLLSPCTPPGMPAPGPLPSPLLSLTGGPGGLGLALHPICVGHPPGFNCRIEVDALSRGADRRLGLGTAPSPGGTVYFSVDPFARGIPGGVVPSVFSEAMVGDASADVFTDLGLPPGPLPPFAAAPLNVGVIDGNGLVSGSGVSYPGLGLVEPNAPVPPPTPGDDLDALNLPDAFPGALAAYYFSLDSGLVDPITLLPNGSSALAHGFVGGDVLIQPGAGPPGIYAPAGLLGLDLFGPDTDDLDALILAENGLPGYQPSLVPNDWIAGGTDMLLFSVRRGSMVIGMPDSIFGLPIEPGDILTTPLPTFMGGLSPFPGIYIAAENLGLLTRRSFAIPHGDDLNALDTVHKPVFDCDGDGIEDAVAIALGLAADANLDGIPDVCQSTPPGTPLCFCPNGGICFNPDANAGCRNSTGAGALLSSAGTDSVSNDDLVLTTTGLPAFSFGVYFMGTTLINTNFGDGILCAGGSIARFLPLVNAGPGGTTSLGPGIVNYTITSMPPAFWIGPGQTWIFQNWYRDSFGPCGTGLNLSNAISVTFTP